MIGSKVKAGLKQAVPKSLSSINPAKGTKKTSSDSSIVNELVGKPVIVNRGNLLMVHTPILLDESGRSFLTMAQAGKEFFLAASIMGRVLPESSNPLLAVIGLERIHENATANGLGDGEVGEIFLRTFRAFVQSCLASFPAFKKEFKSKAFRKLQEVIKV